MDNMSEDTYEVMDDVVIEGYITDSMAENMTDDEIMEYIMQELANREKFKEANV